MKKFSIFTSVLFSAFALVFLSCSDLFSPDTESVILVNLPDSSQRTVYTKDDCAFYVIGIYAATYKEFEEYIDDPSSLEEYGTSEYGFPLKYLASEARITGGTYKS